MIVRTGPNSDGNTTLGAMLWDVFLAEQECLSSAMPYMVAVGNHDVCPVGIDIDGHTGWCGGDSGWECGSEYLSRYRMPGANYSVPTDGYNSTRDCLATYHSVAARYWHAYTHGPIRFVVVSTEHDFGPGSPQLLWLASELAAIDRKATPWVIVYGHRPTYCSGIYLNQCGEAGASHYMAATLRRRMEPLFVKAKVDLVLWGHEHAYNSRQTSLDPVTFPIHRRIWWSRYERIHPAINGHVVGRTTANPAAPINLVLGMGGAGNSYMSGWREPPPEWIAHREMSFGHGRITLLSAAELHFEYVAVDGVAHDEFFLTKGGRRRLKADEQMLVTALALAVPAAAAQRDALFDDDWRFFRGDVPRPAKDGVGVVPAFATSQFDDSGWRALDVPHDWSIEDLPPREADTATPSITIRNGTWRFAKGDQQGAANASFDDAAWMEVTVPHDWRDPPVSYEEKNAVGWYRRKFTLSTARLETFASAPLAPTLALDAESRLPNQ